MCMIPAIRIDKKNKTEIPEWLDTNDIISTSTIKGSRGQIKIYQTCDDEYQQAINVDHMIQLFSQLDGFVSVDRGSMVNMKYVKDIDCDLKVAILENEKRTTISKSKFDLVKELFKRHLHRC